MSKTAATPVSLEKDSPELAQAYDRLSDTQFNQGKLLLEKLHIQPGEHIIDVGGGTGRLGILVADLAGEQSRVVCVDPLPARIDIAKEKGKDRKHFEAYVGCAEDLSAFADASFDVAYLAAVLHWIPDKTTALTEVCRVLKPGGRLGIVMQDANHPHQSLSFVRQALENARIAIDPKAGLPVLSIPTDQLRGMLADIGFVDCENELKTFVDMYDSVDGVIKWWSSSSFGNLVAEAPEAERNTFRAELANAMEVLRTPEGLRTERYMMLITARKA